MLSSVTFSWTNVTPWSIHGLRMAWSGSKSMMVMRLGSTFTWRNRMGSVHRATAPKPTNRIRLENPGIPMCAPLEPSLLELFHEHFGIAAALVVPLAARGRQIVWCAFDEAALVLEIGEGLC